jgi:hypothetical protein
MITVAGEALIDPIVDPAGHVDPLMGGGPFDVTRAVVRLGLPVASAAGCPATGSASRCGPTWSATT